MKSSRLAFSTNAYTAMELEEALRRIAGHGYSAAEILADKPHAWPPDMTDARLQRLGSLLQQLGLRLSNINANTAFGYWSDAPGEPFFEPSLIAQDADQREDRLGLILRSLEMAAALGADCVSITSGRPLGTMNPDAATPVLTDMLGRVLEHADSLGVNVGIECEPGLLLEDSSELADWIARIDHPRLGANLDLGHAIVAGENIAEVLERLRGRIWNIHLEDIRGLKHYHLIPGEGDVDFAAISRSLKDIGYDRFVTIELYTQSANPDQAASLSFQRLADLFT